MSGARSLLTTPSVSAATLCSAARAGTAGPGGRGPPPRNAVERDSDRDRVGPMRYWPASGPCAGAAERSEGTRSRRRSDALRKGCMPRDASWGARGPRGARHAERRSIGPRPEPKAARIRARPSSCSSSSCSSWSCSSSWCSSKLAQAISLLESRDAPARSRRSREGAAIRRGRAIASDVTRG